MVTRKVTASYQVIDLVREAISTPYVRASDAAVARALGITPGSVGGYKSGRDVMGLATLAKAQDFMQLSAPQLAELSIALSMEGAKDPGVLHVWEAIRDVVRGKAASVLGAVAAAAMIAHPEPAQARTECPAEIEANQPLAAVQFIHYAK